MAIDIHQVERDFKQLTELAHEGENYRELLAILSPELRQAIVNEVGNSGNLYIVACWPSSAIADLPNVIRSKR